MTDYFRALLADPDMMFAFFLAGGGISVLLIFMLWPTPNTGAYDSDNSGATEAAGVVGIFWSCLFLGLSLLDLWLPR